MFDGFTCCTVSKMEILKHGRTPLYDFLFPLAINYNIRERERLLVANRILQPKINDGNKLVCDTVPAPQSQRHRTQKSLVKH